MSEEATLKSCPMCGSPGVVIYGGNTREYVPGCASPECVLAVEDMGITYETRERAIEAWNTRAHALTAEQVRFAVYQSGSIDWETLGLCDWQAVADELNAILGGEVSA